MRAANRFAAGLAADESLGRTAAVKAELFGSLGATGHGHGSPKAVILGLLGQTPEDVDPGRTDDLVGEVRATGRLLLGGTREIAFNPDEDVVMHRRRTLPGHPNGMVFRAVGDGGAVLAEKTYYSVGGGFVVDHSGDGIAVKPDDRALRYPFVTAAGQLAQARRGPASERGDARQRGGMAAGRADQGRPARDLGSHGRVRAAAGSTSRRSGYRWGTSARPACG